MAHHVFICHASEDKDAFVRPLATRLKDRGVRIWFDEFSLVSGDSLRESIDRALSTTTYGLVILSKAFFQKRWPQRELNGLVTREIAEQRGLVIPVWYQIEHKAILQFSPPLADLVAIRFTGDFGKVIDAIQERLQWDDPYTQLCGKQHIKIFDRNGSRAEWTLQRTLCVNRDPLKTLEIRITADGTISPTYVHPGIIKSVRTDGGTKMLVIEYPHAIEPGNVFTQTVRFDAREMFQFKKAEGNIMPSLPYEYYDICVELPEPNLPSEIVAYKRVAKREIEIPGLSVNADKTSFAIRIMKPEVGILHSLTWFWEVADPRDVGLK